MLSERIRLSEMGESQLSGRGFGYSHRGGSFPVKLNQHHLINRLIPNGVLWSKNLNRNRNNNCKLYIWSYSNLKKNIVKMCDRNIIPTQCTIIAITMVGFNWVMNQIRVPWEFVSFKSQMKTLFGWTGLPDASDSPESCGSCHRDLVLLSSFGTESFVFFCARKSTILKQKLNQPAFWIRVEPTHLRDFSMYICKKPLVNPKQITKCLVGLHCGTKSTNCWHFSLPSMGEQNWLRLYGKKIQLSQFFDPSFGLQWHLHEPPLEAKGFIVTSSKPRQPEELRTWQLSFQWSGPETNGQIRGEGPSMSILKLKKCFILQLSSIQQGKMHNTRQSMVSGFRIFGNSLKVGLFFVATRVQVDSVDSVGPDARRFHSFAKRVSSWTLVGR